MFNRVLLIIAMVFAVGYSKNASAMIHLQTSIFYQTQDVNGADATQTVVDVTMAYTLPVGLYLGGTYESQDFDSSNWSGFGPTVGFYHSGFHIDFTYFVSMQGELGSADLSEGTGTMFRIGYAAMLSDTIGLGPSLAFRNYTMSMDGGSDFEYQETAPLIDLLLTF